MLEATFEQAYPIAVRAAQVRATAAVRSGAAQPADREDLQQEGLTACWLALPHFDSSRACLRTFIERVVAARLASVSRNARRVPPHDSLKAARPLLVDPEAAGIELRADVRHIVSSLQSRDRQLIFLLLDHSPAEAGRMLGLPRSTVHDRILRLRRRFVAAGYVPRHAVGNGSGR